jgi:hypothetical protein
MVIHKVEEILLYFFKLSILYVDSLFENTYRTKDKLLHRFVLKTLITLSLIVWSAES